MIFSIVSKVFLLFYFIKTKNLNSECPSRYENFTFNQKIIYFLKKLNNFSINNKKIFV